MSEGRDWRQDRILALEQQRRMMVAYLKLKTEADDMYAVADAAMDIRELDAKLKLLKEIG